jgi:hypothetical protein
MTESHGKGFSQVENGSGSVSKEMESYNVWFYDHKELNSGTKKNGVGSIHFSR